MNLQIETYLAGLPVFGLRVLIVEDEKFHAEVLDKMLVVLGFKNIDHAYDGHEALKLAEEEPYHLVITDLDMPGMNGLTFARTLRNNGQSDYAQVPLIMLSCHRDAENIKQAHASGINQYIGKPFDILTLREKILQVYADKPANIFAAHARKAARRGK